MTRSFLLGSVLVGVALTAVGAEDNKKPAWDVSNPPGERRKIPLDVRSGTWMSLDVSPDGKRVVLSAR